MGRLATWPSRILTTIASIKITGQTRSRGRFCQVTMSSITASVIRLIVSREMSVP
jgi:hypothetical protein